MKKSFRREVCILFLSGWAFACSDVAGAPEGDRPKDGAPPAAAAQARAEAEEAVGSPSSARIVQSTPAMSATINGKKVKTLPVVIMVSDDQVDEVAGFYEKKLSGWQHKELLGIHMFWEGETEEHFMTVMASMTRPYVSIQEYDPAFDLRDAGDAVTMITVAYVPEE